MNALPALIATWALTGVGAVLGSILGNPGGKSALFAGAVVGGAVGVWAAVAAVIKLRWLARADRHGALVGGIVGFGIAVPIAVTNLHTPVTPVLACALAGVGLLLGAGFARGWRGSS